MRHKHADLIHAWAEGAEIELYDLGRWQETRTPSFCLGMDYRIKPTPEPVAWEEGRLVEAAESAKNDIHGARLCEVNSMSSRREMLRLMSNATGKLGDALAALDKEKNT